jgi:hypothetical protein
MHGVGQARTKGNVGCASIDLMTFSLIPYFAAIAEAKKTGKPVDFNGVTSEMIQEHMPEANPNLDRHLKGLDWQTDGTT